MKGNSQKSCRFFYTVNDLINANYSIRIKKYRCANVLVIDKPFTGEIYAFQKQPLASFPTSVSNSSLAFEFSRGPINSGLVCWMEISCNCFTSIFWGLLMVEVMNGKQKFY